MSQINLFTVIPLKKMLTVLWTIDEYGIWFLVILASKMKLSDSGLKYSPYLSLWSTWLMTEVGDHFSSK